MRLILLFIMVMITACSLEDAIEIDADIHPYKTVTCSDKGHCDVQLKSGIVRFDVKGRGTPKRAGKQMQAQRGKIVCYQDGNCRWEPRDCGGQMLIQQKGEAVVMNWPLNEDQLKRCNAQNGR